MKKINSISIVDDDPITVFGIKKMLNSLGYDNGLIKIFKNGKDAIDDVKESLANQQRISEVIFLDINMPILDGWGFLAEFIDLPVQETIRINIVTSSIDPYDRQQWESYRQKTGHLITYNNKPIRLRDMKSITKTATDTTP